METQKTPAQPSLRDGDSSSPDAEQESRHSEQESKREKLLRPERGGRPDKEEIPRGAFAPSDPVDE